MASSTPADAFSQARRTWGLLPSTIQHLRFSFSLFLAPVFFFVWSEFPDASVARVVLSFVLIHLALYPASNGYNSYYDRDEGPIGGVAAPLPVDRELLWAANTLDLIAVVGLGALDLWAGILAVIYSLASRAYSHPRFRMKAKPWGGFSLVVLCQGALIFVLTGFALLGSRFDPWHSPAALLAAGLSSLMLAGSYPLTQVYQHEADAARGDETLSRILGVRGTFRFSFCISVLSVIGMVVFLGVHPQASSGLEALLFVACLLPATLFVLNWSARVSAPPSRPQHIDAMRMNAIASASSGFFFVTRLVLHLFAR